MSKTIFFTSVIFNFLFALLIVIVAIYFEDPDVLILLIMNGMAGVGIAGGLAERDWTLKNDE